MAHPPSAVAALSQHQEVPPGPSTVFIGGISSRATESSLKQFLEQFGPVESIRIVIDRTTGKSKGYGFVRFQNRDDAEHLKRLQFVTFSGKAMNVGDSYKGPPLNELKQHTLHPSPAPPALQPPDTDVVPNKRVHIFILDNSSSLCEVFRHALVGLHRGGGFTVTVSQERLSSLPAFDAVVAAGNSCGFLEGGMEGAIASMFGDELVPRIQQHILTEYDGEQPVGTAFVAHTNDPQHPYVIHAPVMRVPMPINLTDNVYLATKAALKAIADHNRKVIEGLSQDSLIRIAVFPTLGINYGKMPASEAARQMALAIRNWLQVPRQLNWQFAGRRQDQVAWGGTPKSCEVQAVWRLLMRPGVSELTAAALVRELALDRVKWGKAAVERGDDNQRLLLFESTLICPINVSSLERLLLQQPAFQTVHLISLIPAS